MLVYPPSMRGQARGQYTLQLASMPRTPSAPRSAMLINAIVGMSAAQKHLPTDPRTTEVLIAVYLSGSGPIPKANRQEIHDNMRAGVREKVDADWTILQWLLSLEALEAESDSPK